MEKSKLIMNSQSLLARLLATENIKVRHRQKVTTAYFDLQYRELVLPMWKDISSDLYDMLVIHEVGHALETPGEAWYDAINKNPNKIINNNRDAFKSYLNVIEDTRIDRLQKRRYPGSKKSYVKGYGELWDRDFFELKKRNLTFDKLDFIDRVNCFYKGGASKNIPFSEKEKDMLKQIDALETFDDVVEYTTVLFLTAGFKKGTNKVSLNISYNDSDELFSVSGNLDAFKDFLNSFSDKLFDISKAFEKEDESPESADDAVGDRDIESVRQEYEKDESLIEDAVDREKNTPVYDADDDELPDFKEVEDDRWVPPVSVTNDAYQESMVEISDSSDKKISYGTFPEPYMDQIVDDYPKVLNSWIPVYENYSPEYRKTIVRNINDFKTDENAAISYMIKEFQLKKAAQDYSKVTITKTGILNTSKLHSYRYNEDIFKKIYNQPTGKNHGFVIFLDWSSSMDNKIFDTFKQLMSISYFCKRVQIPFDVYIFRSLAQNDYPNKDFYVDDIKQFSDRETDIGFGNFKVRNVLSSRMSASEFNMAVQCFWTLVLNTRSYYGGGAGGFSKIDPMSGTPLDQTVYIADKIVNEFKRKNNLEVVNTIFMTDGEGEWFSNRKTVYEDDFNGNLQYTCEYESGTKMFLERLKILTGTNLIGFYLFDDGPSEMIKRFFPELLPYAPKYAPKIRRQPKELIEPAGEPWKAKIDEFSENGFVPVTNKGYDDYYIIKATYLKLMNDDMKVDGDQTKGQKVRQFMKYTTKRQSNRLLLQRFITLISS